MPDKALRSALIAKTARFASRSYLFTQISSQPVLKSLITRLFYAGWSLTGSKVFEGDLNGFRIRFYDPGGPDHYWTSFYGGVLHEQPVLLHLRRLASKFKAPVLLDVGAHYGIYTVYMSKLAGPSGFVHSFEPSRDFFRVLGTNVKLNDLRNVMLHHVALSDKIGSIILETSDRFKASGFPGERRKMHWLEDMTAERRRGSESGVNAFPFDELAKKENIEPDIVKIDVHGAEGNVINGMKESLRRSVSHIYCELHQEMTDGYTARDVVHALRDVGMETFEFRGFRTERGHLVSISDDLTLPPGGTMVYGRK